MSRTEQLIEIRDLSSKLVHALRQQEYSPQQAFTAMSERQQLVESLTGIDIPMTGSERGLVKEIASLDRIIAHWCRSTQKSLAKQMMKTRSTKKATMASRIISQHA